MTVPWWLAAAQMMSMPIQQQGVVVGAMGAFMGLLFFLWAVIPNPFSALLFLTGVWGCVSSGQLLWAWKKGELDQHPLFR